MRGRIASALALSCAALLVTGCSGPAGMSQTVASIVKQSGGNVVTRVVVGAEAADIQVAVRVPGGEQWWTRDGLVGPVPAESKQPLGGTGPDAIDFEALSAQQAALAGQCSDTPRLEAYVAPTGALAAESVCGTAGNREVLATTIDGVMLGPVAVDFLSTDGLAQLLVETAASLPGGFTYQITLPGPKSPRGYTAKAEGTQWVLPDGEICMVNFVRAGAPAPGEPARTFGCDGYGSQEGDLGAQDPIFPETLDAAKLLSAIDRLVEDNAVDPETVAFYRIDWPLIGGLHVGVLTEDQQFFEAPVETP